MYGYPEICRNVVLLRDIEDLVRNQSALALGIPVAVVEVWLKPAAWPSAQGHEAVTLDRKRGPEHVPPALLLLLVLASELEGGLEEDTARSGTGGEDASGQPR